MSVGTDDKDGEGSHPFEGDSPKFDPTVKRSKARVAAALFGEAAHPSGAPSLADEVDETMVDRYQLENRIGSGAMGVVYEANDPQLERRVAIKVLHERIASNDQARTRLVREARALARVSHPNVIQVFDAGEDAKRVFVAMEFVQGATLKRWRLEQERGWLELLDVLLDAGTGLVAAHEVGLVHRDFKPENVLIGKDHRVRVVDFGLARTLGSAPIASMPHAVNHRPNILSVAAQGSLTQTGSITGTPLYMSPEQLLDGTAADELSDQYSYCTTVYEMLYGQYPYEGVLLGEIARNMRDGKLRPPPALTEVPDHVFRIIKKGLSPDPNDRFTKLSQLLSALRSARSDVMDVPTIVRSSPRSRVAAMLLLAVSLGLGGLLWQRSQSRSDSSLLASSQDSEQALGAGTSASIPDESVSAPSLGLSGSSENAAVALSFPVMNVGEGAANRKREGLAYEPPTVGLPSRSRLADSESESEDTTVDAEASGSARKRIRAKKRSSLVWCNVHEDTFQLLAKGNRKRVSLTAKGSCYECRPEIRKAKIRRIGGQCDRYMVCGEVSKEKCKS